jgi:hypothetical protein
MLMLLHAVSESNILIMLYAAGPKVVPELDERGFRGIWGECVAKFFSIHNYMAS